MNISTRIQHLRTFRRLPVTYASNTQQSAVQVSSSTKKQRSVAAASEMKKDVKHYPLNFNVILKMSDLNDDLLNYELGDDIDDHALYGADEDELLLSDDELEKDVTNEVKQQLKAEAEQWVQSQINEKEQHNGDSKATSCEQQLNELNQSTSLESNVEVSSTAAALNPNTNATQCDSDVSTSEESPIKNGNTETFKQPPHQQNNPFQITPEQLLHSQQMHHIHSREKTNTFTDEVTSSSSKELELEHSSVTSCSMAMHTDSSSSVIQSSQESSTVGTVMSGELSDPREDPDEEREERTNIKTTSERETENLIGLSPDKTGPRFILGKRGGGNPLLRSGPHLMRGGPYPGQRPLLRYPPHGNFPLMAHYSHLQHMPHLLTTELLPQLPSTTTSSSLSSSLLTGQFLSQQQSPHPYATHTTHLPGASAPSGGPQSQLPTQQQQHNPITQNHPHLHDPNNPHPHLPPSQLKPRHSYPGYRAGTPGGFRHPNPSNMYASGPRDYNVPGGTQQYNQNFGPIHGHPPRVPLYRPEMPGIPPGMRPGMRLQRPQHGIPLNPNNYGNGQHLRHPQSQATALQMPQANAATSIVGASGAATQAMSMTSNPLQASAVRPSKVLINPNFKGGVEAATSKFIKETQFMSTISSHVSHLQSDEELLRQQEEFINKNRQHIEKRRHERSPPMPMRRSHTRSRSHSRERSYSPVKRNIGSSGSGSGVNERHFERERERDRERDRDRVERVGSGGGSGSGGGGVGGGSGGGSGERFLDRDRERDRGVNHERFSRGNSRERERDRDRPGSGIGNGNRGNRFRRGNSRDRDYENRGNAANYGKRRRSLSPLPMRGGRRGGDRDRNDVEEDEETRVYRLEIEKQKTLREKIFRDKEMRRRRAAEVKLSEDKPTTINSGSINDDQHQKQLQKLKPIIVTESKIISLKKKQQQQRDNEDNVEQQQHPHHHHFQQAQHQPSHQQQQRKQIPTAKILPEAKRSLTEHLSNVSGSGSGVVTGSNTAIIKPVQKQDTMSSTPPTTAVVAPTAMTSKYSRHMSSPSDDEVELDYDEDELMLDEEDRLLASPTPPPQQLPRTRTPTPEPTKQQYQQHREQQQQLQHQQQQNQQHQHSSSKSSSNYHSSSANSGSRNQQSNHKPFATSNRRVVLKSSSSSSASRRDEDNNNSSSRNRHSGGNHRDNHSRDGGGSNSSSSRSKGIFDRLDVRNKMSGDTSNNKSQRKSQQQQRIVMKNN